MIHERMLDTPRGRIRCLEAGAGWPVVLLHAFPLTADMWRPQLERVTQGWRFLAPDTRGFGSSGPGSSPPSMDEYAADVEAVLDSLEIESAAIGGLSMGGYIALALHRRVPERFTAMVLADTKAGADTAEAREARRAMSGMVRTKGPGAVADAMLPKLLGTAASADEQIVSEVRRLIESNTAAGLDDAIQAMMGRPDSTPDLAGLSVPVLVVVGAEDQLTPLAHSQILHRETPRSQLVVIPEAGHLSSLEAPDVFSTALENFLTSSM